METLKPSRLIGEAMLEQGLIKSHQLEEGLRYQSRVSAIGGPASGGKKLIGETLVELGYLREQSLQDFLAGFFSDYKSAIAAGEIRIVDDIGDLITYDFEKWLIFMAKKGASDLHLISNAPPQLRIDGSLVSAKLEPLTPDRIEDLAYSILSYKEREIFEETKALDKSFEIEGVSRYRINMHHQRDSIGVSVRALPLEIPRFEDLGIPEILKDFASRQSGLVLITGATGSGKSTTLAAMIEHINLTRAVNIVTIEDPIEYVFYSKKSLIRQRELGRDTLSFKEALKSIVRQDPNIILIGEMRDLDTIQAALTLAETGHLIFSTLHTPDATHVINRIVDVFPVEHQQEIRVKLSLVLQGAIVQQLMPKADGKGRALACEVLNCTPSIRNLIRENNLAQIRLFIQIGNQHGMKSMNQALLDLYDKGIIAWEDAYARSNDREDLLRLIPKPY